MGEVWFGAGDVDGEEELCNCFVIDLMHEIMYQTNTALCPIKANSNTIELTVDTSYYCV